MYPPAGRQQNPLSISSQLRTTSTFFEDPATGTTRRVDRGAVVWESTCLANATENLAKGQDQLEDIVKPAEPGPEKALARLPYFVEWRPCLWVPAVRWLIGDPARFKDKKVLEVGCRSGRMSCLFGMLGAQVLGVDLPGVSLEPARQEAALAGVSNRVRFLNHGADMGTLLDDEFDFVFTKSALVMIPELAEFLAAIAPMMRADGELLAAENLAGGRLLQFVRRVIADRRRAGFLNRFHGVNATFLATLGRMFEVVGQRRFYGLVTALRARPRTITSAIVTDNIRSQD
jgi:SAM-dependent methyltransferase